MSDNIPNRQMSGSNNPIKTFKKIVDKRNAIVLNALDAVGIINKDYCSICDSKLGRFNTVKLYDAQICKHCFDLRSEWLTDKGKNMSLDQFEEHLYKRKESADRFSSFSSTRVIGENDKVYIDDNNEMLYFSPQHYHVPPFPDVFLFSEVVGFNAKVERESCEIMIEDPDMGIYSFSPPCYAVYYNFYVAFEVAVDYVNTIQLQLNEYEVSGDQDLRVAADSKRKAIKLSRKPYKDYFGKTSDEDYVKSGWEYQMYEGYIKELKDTFSGCSKKSEPKIVKKVEEKPHCSFCGIRLKEEDMVCPSCGGIRRD